MATVSLTPTTAATTFPNRNKAQQPYIVWKTVTGAAARAAKGSALASADVIEFLNIPANTQVMWARMYVQTADTGTTATADLGYGGNVDVFSDGVDISGSTGWGALGTNGKINGTTANLFTSADTLDIVLATYSGSNDDWVVQIAVQLCDLSVPYIPNSTFP